MKPYKNLFLKTIIGAPSAPQKQKLTQLQVYLDIDYHST